jgi:hypothetical protein
MEAKTSKKATSRQVSDRIFAAYTFVVGLLIFIVATISFNKISDDCTTKMVRDCLTVILVLGAIMVTIALSYVFCNIFKSDCYVERKETSLTDIYMSITGVISFGISILIIVTFIKLKHSDNKACMGEQPNASDSDKKNAKTLVFNLWFIFGLSTLSMLMTLVGLYYTGYIIPGEWKLSPEERERAEKSLKKIEAQEKRVKKKPGEAGGGPLFPFFDSSTSGPAPAKAAPTAVAVPAVAAPAVAAPTAAPAVAVPAVAAPTAALAVAVPAVAAPAVAIPAAPAPTAAPAVAVPAVAAPAVAIPAAPASASVLAGFTRRRKHFKK